MYTAHFGADVAHFKRILAVLPLWIHSSSTRTSALLLLVPLKACESRHLYLAWKKSSGQKKACVKSTYPPPADGLRFCFLCKPGRSANDPLAQTGRGPLQVVCDCTQCKVLQRSAARLHGSPESCNGAGGALVPGFIGGIVEKGLLRPVFQILLDQFEPVKPTCSIGR